MIDTDRILAETFVAYAEHHPVLDSTQTRARSLAACVVERGTELPALIVADLQTAGRGRATNRWWTGEGSLAFSLLIDPKQFGFPPRAVPRLSLAAGVAIIDSLAPQLTDFPLGLHWPNDVYVGRGKLAGILVEVLPDGKHIIGVGLNSNCTAAGAPAELRDSIATLADLTGKPHDHTDLIVSMMDNFEAALASLSAPMAQLGERFDLLCLQRGDTLTVYQGEQQITGRCTGIGVDGSLLLDTADGRREILSGTLKPPGQW